MGNTATVRRSARGRWIGVLTLFAGLGAGIAGAQAPDWVHVGSAAIDLGLADLATGPVERVWYSDQGQLRIRTLTKVLWSTSDFATWQPLTGVSTIPAPFQETASTIPEEGAQLRRAPSDSRRMYAMGRFVYRSDDGGRHWQNISGLKGFSNLGTKLRDLAVSLRNADELTVVGDAGVFRSLDGGGVWHGLNDNLPNLPGSRLVGAPGDGHGPQIDAGGRLLEWFPGELRAWSQAVNRDADEERSLKMTLSNRYGVEVTAIASNPINDYLYVGDGNGNIRVSSTFGDVPPQDAIQNRGRVNAFWVDPKDPRLAIAVFSSGAVMHTISGGLYWVPVTGKLLPGSVNAVTADRASNTVYIASDAGVFYSRFPLDTLGGTPDWAQIVGLPAGHVTGVGLDAEKTQLWVSLEGPGVYRALAPHRLLDPLVVSAADRRQRALSPGAVVSVVGARVESATADGVSAAVLDANDVESQVQLPYSLDGSRVSLALDGPGGRREYNGLELRPASPAIFELDGTPLLEDAIGGGPIDTANPGKSHMRVRIIVEGLGRVRGDLHDNADPMEEHEVIAPVMAFLDRTPVEVVRAVLAPGYSGVYWVEIELPTILQFGMAELYLEVGGQESNHVRFFVESGLY